MAVRDEEMDDEEIVVDPDHNWTAWEARQWNEVAMPDDSDWDGRTAHDDEEAFEQVITVRFTVAGDNIRGRVVKDVRGKARTKIVFPARTWLGPKPKDGEELRVSVVHETKDMDPKSGALFVARILPRLTFRSYTGMMIACTKPGCKGLVPARDHQTLKPLTSGTCEACGTTYEILNPGY